MFLNLKEKNKTESTAKLQTFSVTRNISFDPSDITKKRLKSMRLKS